MQSTVLQTAAAVLLLALAGCTKEETPVAPQSPSPRDPNTTTRVAVDRFSSAAGMLFVRDGSNGLPGPNQPVNFDQGPFVTSGFGPNGELVTYYNFDVQPTTPANIYVLFMQGQSTPVAGQLNIIDVTPGMPGYNDFWRVVRVTVPSTYVANTVTSAVGIMSAGFSMEATTMIVNCPVVPEGSTATLRAGGGSTGLVRGWYRDQVALYFTFEEHPLTLTGGSMVALSPIYVTFNINPGLPGGGPPSGFMIDVVTGRTRNVVATIPLMSGYSPLWSVYVFDNANFTSVSNLATAQATTILGMGVATVNCPVVQVQ